MNQVFQLQLELSWVSWVGSGGWRPLLGEKGDSAQTWELGQGCFSSFFCFLSPPVMAGAGGGGGVVTAVEVEEEDGPLGALMILASDFSA